MSNFIDEIVGSLKGRILTDGKESLSVDQWWDDLPGRRRSKVIDILGMDSSKNRSLYNKLDDDEQSEIEAYFKKYGGHVEGIEVYESSAKEAGKYFVLVDVGVAGGKLVYKKLYRGVKEADKECDKLRKQGRDVQVIDATWYAPADDLFKNKDESISLKGSLLSEEDQWMGDELNSGQKKLVSEIGRRLKWDVVLAAGFSVDLLQDVNAHKEAAEVNKVLLKSLGKYINPKSKKEGIDLKGSLLSVVGIILTPKEVDAFIKSVKKLTDINNSTEAAIELAKFLDVKRFIKLTEAIAVIHDVEGSMPSEIGKYLHGILKQMWQAAEDIYGKDVGEKIYGVF